MTVHAGSIKFIFKILDFYVKSHAFVKLANFATISKKKKINLIFFDRHTYLYIFA